MEKITSLSLEPRRSYSYAFMDTPDDETLAVLGTVPGRWGRMPPLSRAMVVETGRILRERSLLSSQTSANTAGLIGLIGGTARGSLTPDLDFAATLLAGVNLASPALFGYTLANIPLAEAANHYHLTGPVYAIIDAKTPLDTAVREAGRLIRMQPAFAYILACAFDDYLDAHRQERLSLTFTLLQNNA